MTCQVLVCSCCLWRGGAGKDCQSSGCAGLCLLSTSPPMLMLSPCTPCTCCPHAMPHSLIQRHAKAKTYMSEEQLLGYFVQLVAALAHVHAIGILHRDIKTNNVFLTGQGLLKLGDFGISKVRRQTDSCACVC